MGVFLKGAVAQFSDELQDKFHLFNAFYLIKGIGNRLWIEESLSVDEVVTPLFYPADKCSCGLFLCGGVVLAQVRAKLYFELVAYRLNFWRWFWFCLCWLVCCFRCSRRRICDTQFDRVRVRELWQDHQSPPLAATVSDGQYNVHRVAVFLMGLEVGL